MDKLLFQHFLEEPGEYEAAERFWSDIFEEVVRGTGQAGTWAPWRPRHYVNGAPFEQDRNPIFDARSTKLGRAVQVIQWPPEGNDGGICAWLARLSIVDKNGSEETVTELTINLSLSEESAAVARTLLSGWVDPEVTEDEMTERVGQLAPPG